jgi:hypothetical protein
MSKRNNKLHMIGGVGADNYIAITNGLVYDVPQNADMNPPDKRNVVNGKLQPLSHHAFCDRKVFCKTGFTANGCNSKQNNKDVICVPMTDSLKKTI